MLNQRYIAFEIRVTRSNVNYRVIAFTSSKTLFSLNEIFLFVQEFIDLNND